MCNLLLAFHSTVNCVRKHSGLLIMERVNLIISKLFTAQKLGFSMIYQLLYMYVLDIASHLHKEM